MFLRLEQLLIYESKEKLENLHWLMKIRKSKGKGTKNKSSSGGVRYVYLRPFTKSFLRCIRRHYKIILFSYKESKTVEAITETINGMFEDDIFEAFVSLPSFDSNENECFDLKHFMNPKEGRIQHNWYVMDTWPMTWKINYLNALPITQFKGYEKDNTLFLWEKFIEWSLDSKEDLAAAIGDAFYD